MITSTNFNKERINIQVLAVDNARN